MDDYPSPSKVTIIHIQDWVSSDVGFRGVSSPVLHRTEYVRKRHPPPKTSNLFLIYNYSSKLEINVGDLGN